MTLWHIRDHGKNKQFRDSWLFYVYVCVLFLCLVHSIIVSHLGLSVHSEAPTINESNRIESWFFRVHRQQLGYLTDGCQDWRQSGLRAATQRQSGEALTSVSAGQIILTPTQPAVSEWPGWGSKPWAPGGKSNALPTNLLPPPQILSFYFFLPPPPPPPSVCAPGWYGANCQSKCSEFCEGGDFQCLPIDGTCIMGCTGDYIPPKCEGTNWLSRHWQGILCNYVLWAFTTWLNRTKNTYLIRLLGRWVSRLCS